MGKENAGVQGISILEPKRYTETPFCLLGISGFYAGKRIPLVSPFGIGRDPRKNQLLFPYEARGISREHCVLLMDGDTVWLRDLRSTYGTYACGRLLTGGEIAALHPGDEFRLGEKEVFRILRRDDV